MSKTIPDLEHAKAVKRKMAPRWMSIPGVEAVGIGMVPKGGIALIISTSEPVENMRSHFPEEVEGIPVHLNFTGKFSISP